MVTSIAAAPSEICEALPAVTVPPSSNAGRSPASTSSVVPGRIPSSCDTVTAPSPSPSAQSRTAPSAPRTTGTISSANAPDSRAAAARWWDCTLNRSTSSRRSPHCRATISALTPWLKSTPA